MNGTESRIGTHVRGLDERIGGGIPAGFTVLICGPSGSLKSSLAFNILYHSTKDQGLRSLYLSVEQSKESLLGQASSLGLSVEDTDTLNVVDLAKLRRETEKPEEVNWIATLQDLLVKYNEEFDPQLLAIDSLDALYALSSLKNPRNEIFTFFESLRDLNLTAFLVSEMPREGGFFGKHGVEEFLSDGIIHLRLKEVEVGRTTSVRRFIGIAKMRGTKHELDYYPLLVDKSGFEVLVE
ncbi:MAG: AAA family ATPase [Methanobacteriota archaeon]|nr:MAG: AAA family ATPase [Euryarchaeota archaeon]